MRNSSCLPSRKRTVPRSRLGYTWWCMMSHKEDVDIRQEYHKPRGSEMHLQWIIKNIRGRVYTYLTKYLSCWYSHLVDYSVHIRWDREKKFVLLYGSEKRHSRWGGSNSQPLGYKLSALVIELNSSIASVEREFEASYRHPHCVFFVGTRNTSETMHFSDERSITDEI